MFNRPGGMSDEEMDNQQESSFAKQDVNAYSKCFQSDLHGDTENATITSNTHNNDLAFELRAIEACIKGDINVIEDYLYTHSANNFLHTGWTLLLYAASSVQREVIDYLLNDGADPNIHKDGYTPLMALCNSTKSTPNENLSCLLLLLEAGADVNACNKLRETALMFACESKEPDFISKLLENVNNINACDNQGKTALMYAVTANKIEVVKVLLQNKADVELTDRNNMSAIDIARLKEYDEILHLFNYEEKNELPAMVKTKKLQWKDMFPSLSANNDESLSYDVATMLYGMGLEGYSNFFQGIDLKTFMRLTKQDLSRVGIDINVHREQFMEHLHKFHVKKWSAQSIGILDKSKEFTVYDGVISLGTVATQTSIIASSFHYIRNIFHQLSSENVCLTREQKLDFKKQIQITHNVLENLRWDVSNLKNCAEKIDKEVILKEPACYIGQKKCKTNWSLLLGASFMVIICISGKRYIQRILKSVIN